MEEEEEEEEGEGEGEGEGEERNGWRRFEINNNVIGRGNKKLFNPDIMTRVLTRTRFRPFIATKTRRSLRF